MRHRYAGKKLSRGTDERRRLFSGLMRQLFLHNGIETTLAKAQAVRPLVDKLITKAKKDERNARRSVMRVLGDKQATDIVLSSVKTRFSERTSGYTRMYKLGPRLGDNAEKVLIRFVDEEVAPPAEPKKEKKAPEKKEEKKEEKKAALRGRGRKQGSKKA